MANTNATPAGSAAPLKNPLAKYFRNYFRARWQNWQNLISNEVFFSKMPSSWLTYQQAYVRQWDEWSRGFVLQLHRKDMFSVGMGYTVCDIVTRECMKGGFRFDGAEQDANKFANDWAEENNLNDVVAKGFMNANRLGNNILRLNVVAGGHEVYPSAHGVDRVYFEINRKQEIVRARFIDYLTADTYKGDEYYTVEDRIFMDGAPYYRVKLYKNAGNITNPSFNDVGAGIERLDYFTRSRFADLYGDIKPNVWYKLPFRTLGCYNWQNKAASVSINSMPGYSDSTLHTALDVLYSIDYNWSMGQLDMYWGRTRVVIPKEFKKRETPLVIEGRTYQEAMSAEAELSDDVYMELPSGNTLSDKPVQPTFMQPDLRGETHKYIRDADLELLASKVGLSSSTLANHLTYNNSKTATEVDAESDTTETTVGNKRDFAARAINEMISDVLAFYGVIGGVSVTWNQSGNNKRTRQNVLDEFNARLMPLREAVKRLHPELTESDVDEWCQRLENDNREADVFSDASLLGV